MLFNSYIFILLFLPIAVAGYYVINRYKKQEKGTTDLWWLFLASCFFYGYVDITCLILLLASVCVNYYVSTKINVGRIQGNLANAKGWMISGVIFNLALLIYFKYFDFFVTNINQLLVQNWTWKSLILPLGISFFTFKQIAYIVDCYGEKEIIEYSWIEYATYVMFFPQLISGPIGLHYEFIPQMRDKARKTVDYNNLSQGLYALSLGLAKKVLIADNLSKLVTVGYSKISELNGMTAWFVMLAYTMQIYFDFSGYSDMALGIEKMLNLDPVINFNSPYKAKTVNDFWKRWHMSLTRFFTRYVYIPLGGSRKGKERTYLNTVIVFLLSGLWHGANWTFILWGFLHGLFMAIEKLVRDLRNKLIHIRISNKCLLVIGRLLGTVYTFLFVNVAWILFRATSIKEAKLIISRLFVGGSEIMPGIVTKTNDLVEMRVLARLGMGSFISLYPQMPCTLFLTILLIGVFLTKNTQEKMLKEKYSILRSGIAIMLIVWSVVSFADVSEFLYFEF